MTEHRDDKNNDLKAYLEGKDGVSATYDKLGKSEVPAHLDRLILNAAREDEDKKSGSGNSNSYFSQKYSIAASVLICVLIGGIYLTDQDVLQRESDRMPASTRPIASDFAPPSSNENSDMIAGDAPQQQQRAFAQAPEAAPADTDASIASTGNIANAESPALLTEMELSRQAIAESTDLVAEQSEAALREQVAQSAGSSEAEFSPEPIILDQDSLVELVEEGIAADTTIERQQVAASVDEDTEEVVVTGSRIRTDGMESPNPVVVVTLDEIQLTNPASLLDGLADLPQFRASYTTETEETSDSDTSDTVIQMQQIATTGADEDSEEVVITGSRIRIDGMESPNPVTVVNLEEIQILDQESMVTTGPANSTFYRDTPETWALYINGLTDDLMALTLDNLAKSSGGNLDENADEVVITGSRIRLPEEDGGMTAGSTDGNTAPAPVETLEVVSEEDALRALIELERREFADTYPDSDLDALIEEIRSNE